MIAHSFIIIWLIIAAFGLLTLFALCVPLSFGYVKRVKRSHSFVVRVSCNGANGVHSIYTTSAVWIQRARMHISNGEFF
jgi:hypothetical protein